MSWFSERNGLSKIKTDIQIDSMSTELRNQLWNVMLGFYLGHNEDKVHFDETFKNAFFRIWSFYFKQPTDTLPQNPADLYLRIRKYFFEAPWNEIYDFLEAIVYYRNQIIGNDHEKAFQVNCNNALESELSAYRFVNGKITQITSKEEISQIEEAIKSPISVVNTHLQNALRLFSDRQSPDYRNSIKESISSVEAICKLIANNEKTTLGNALNIIEREGKVVLHPSLKSAFQNLYAYTSDADGIRHALKDEKVNADFEEAKFMLVTCSAFVNYLISKASKAGIKL